MKRGFAWSVGASASIAVVACSGGDHSRNVPPPGEDAGLDGASSGGSAGRGGAGGANTGGTNAGGANTGGANTGGANTGGSGTGGASSGGTDAGAGGTVDAGSATHDAGAPDASDAGAPGPCQGPLDCAGGLRCEYGVCVPSVPCTTNDDCLNDAYCDTDLFCVPWGIPPAVTANATCERPPQFGPFDVVLQCSFTEPPADQLPASNQVMTTPSVADLDLDHDPTTVAPSLVFATYDTQSYPALITGNLRIIDGRTCAHQQSLIAPEDRVVSTAIPALADLDGDGRIEIVTPRAAAYGGVIAFSQDANGKYQRLFTSAVCDNQGGRVDDGTGKSTNYMGGVSVHDLDDDGKPEIIFGTVVYDSKGCLLDGTHGLVTYLDGNITTLADLDSNGQVEVATGDQLLSWSSGHWIAAPRFVGSHTRGMTAIADFGDFGEGPGVADIVNIASGSATIETIDGKIAFGPFSPAGLYRGGPPTVADFDGDGRPEFAAAGASKYVVFDPDCDVDPLPADCESRGIRWTKPSQDLTSNVTGSSVFDFEGDGAAEVAYADECFLRVYDGKTGAVKWSTARASGTAYEYPLIADVDGDFHTEIVVGTDDWPSGCSGADPLFPSATFSSSHGVFVYASKKDDWAGSRMLWNQHAYSVTNVLDDGKIPRTSAWQANWKVPKLNDFRQNVQGTVAPLAAVDLTVSCRPGACTPQAVSIDCSVCNRGAQGVDRGVPVSFTTNSDAGTPFCQTTTNASLLPGGCSSVSCDWTDPPRGAPADVHVFVDTGDGTRECFEKNDQALITGFSCPPT
ncbi:MAG TPA: VCBS repeat-containing protein [Polyangiaceae bacterium]|nr:VCBS repeat-containing protein [Polyangiaceae bacterium]